jgi:periplasmic mercuric ion binding protein
MKTTFLTLMCLFSFVSLAQNIEVPTVAAASKVVTVGIKGMVCAFCSAGLKKTFKKETGVTAVVVSLEKKAMILTVDDTFVMNDEAIQERVKDTGFEASQVTRGTAAP